MPFVSFVVKQLLYTKSFQNSLEVTDIVPFYGIDKTKNLVAWLRDFNIVEKSY
ncbi:hypothetical protein M876_03445 [Elizabethkingia anophelis FMS-007]|nr:hypothetical protein M876_03445 [Elizabethkingia anophelis FMS-007]